MALRMQCSGGCWRPHNVGASTCAVCRHAAEQLPFPARASHLRARCAVGLVPAAGRSPPPAHPPPAALQGGGADSAWSGCLGERAARDLVPGRNQSQQASQVPQRRAAVLRPTHPCTAPGPATGRAPPGRRCTAQPAGTELSRQHQAPALRLPTPACCSPACGPATTPCTATYLPPPPARPPARLCEAAAAAQVEQREEVAHASGAAALLPGGAEGGKCGKVHAAAAAL